MLDTSRLTGMVGDFHHLLQKLWGGQLRHSKAWAHHISTYFFQSSVFS